MPPSGRLNGVHGTQRSKPDGAESIGRRGFCVGAASIAATYCLPSLPVAWARSEEVLPTLRAQRLAWAGIRLQLEKATLFLDPLANAGVWGAALKDTLVSVDVTEGARFVLVTHRHSDHFDLATVRKVLGETGTLVFGPDGGGAAAPSGLRVRTAQLYEPVLLGDFTVTAVPAADGYGDPQFSWVVSGGGRRIIHCGDTLWHGSWWQIRQLGPFDAAFLPINGARFGWRKPVSDVAAVLTPEQAVAAAVVMGARLIVPIHYGVSGADSYSEVPDAEKGLLEAARKRGIAVEVARPGEWLTWQARA